MSRGFTLVEIAVAIFLVAVLSAVAMVGIAGTRPDFELAGSARSLLSDLRLAQQKTVSEQINYCVKLFVSEKKYQIQECESGQVISEKFLPSEIASFSQAGFSEDRIEFNPYGAVKESGVVILQNSRGSQKHIDVRPSGFVKYY